MTTRSDDDIPVPVAASPPASPGVAAQLDALHLAVGGADPLQVDRMGHLIGVLSRSAVAALSAVSRAHAAIADMQPIAEQQES
jgi:hypothetical protein